MPRGKQPLLDKPVEWKLSIPTSVDAAVTAKLVTLSASWRNTDKPSYGARSKLVKQLLDAWLAGEINIANL